MSPPQRRATDEGGTDTRQRLLDAAIDLIENAGPAAATSRAITATADANLGAITYYFGSKDALVAAALADAGRRLLQPVIDALSDASSPIEQMLRASRLLPEVLGANPGALRGYVQALAIAVHDPGVREAIAALHHDMMRLLAEQIRSHQDAEIVPTWVDPEAMSAVIVSLVDGVAVTTAAGLTDSEPFAIAGQFVNILVRTAQPGPSRDPTDWPEQKPPA